MGKASRLKRERREQELLALKLQVKILEARPTRTNQPGTWRRIPPIGKALIGVAVPLFGLWIGYVQTIKPRILILPPSKSVDPANPYDAPFTLINDGYFSVYKLSIDCDPALVAATALDPASPTNVWRVHGFVRHDVLNLDTLPATERKPFVCNAFKQIQPTNVRVDGVELEVKVSVSPFSFINWAHPKSVLFEADGDGTTKFQWHELGIGERPHFPQSSILLGLLPDGRIEGTVRP